MHHAIYARWCIIWIWLCRDMVPAACTGRVQGPVTLTILQACKASAERSHRLCSDPLALPIWMHLLGPLMALHADAAGQAALADDPGNECLGLLVRCLALQQGFLEPLLRLLGASDLLFLLCWPASLCWLSD